MINTFYFDYDKSEFIIPLKERARDVFINFDGRNGYNEFVWRYSWNTCFGCHTVSFIFDSICYGYFKYSGNMNDLSNSISTMSGLVLSGYRSNLKSFKGLKIIKLKEELKHPLWKYMVKLYTEYD